MVVQCSLFGPKRFNKYRQMLPKTSHLISCLVRLFSFGGSQLAVAEAKGTFFPVQDVCRLRGELQSSQPTNVAFEELPDRVLHGARLKRQKCV